MCFVDFVDFAFDSLKRDFLWQRMTDKLLRLMKAQYASTNSKVRVL